MRRFKIGDEVRLIKVDDTDEPIYHDLVGSIGIVIEDDESAVCPYLVRFNDSIEEEYVFAQDELILLSEEKFNKELKEVLK